MIESPAITVTSFFVCTLLTEPGCGSLDFDVRFVEFFPFFLEASNFFGYVRLRFLKLSNYFYYAEYSVLLTSCHDAGQQDQELVKDLSP